MSNYKKAILALILANTIWGASSPIYKWSLIGISPLLLAFYRLAIPTIILLLFAKKIQRIRLRDFLSFVMLGILNCTLSIGLYFMGLLYAPSIDAPIIGSSGPIFILLASAIFLKDRATKKTLFGNLVGLTGVLFIVLQPVAKTAHEYSILGNTLFIFATLAASFATILAKKLTQKYNFITITFWTFLIGSISFLPIPIDIYTHHLPLFIFNIHSAIGILYGALGGSLIAYLLYFWGMHYIKASQTTIFNYMDPVVTIIIAIPLLHEYPDAIFIFGSLLIIAGIYIAEGRIHWHPLHKLLE